MPDQNWDQVATGGKEAKRTEQIWQPRTPKHSKAKAETRNTKSSMQ